MNKLVDMVSYFNKVSTEIHWNEAISNNEDHEKILTNLIQFPHAIIFMAVVDCNNKDGFPEAIAYEYWRANNDFSFLMLAQLTYNDFKHNMLKTNLSPTEEEIKLIYDAIQVIKKHFNANPANVWNDCPSSSILKQRLTMFGGINSEKANLLALLLVQKFHIKLADNKEIVISYDSRIIATMKRIGLIDSIDKSYEEIKFITRKINPDYPGIFDGFFSMIGKYIIEGSHHNSILNASKENIIADCIQAVNELKVAGIIN